MVHINPSDGVCRACGGTLHVTGAADATMFVECECGEGYSVETDAFGSVGLGLALDAARRFR